jgi:DHA1 family tetracycline resistance protein-like MFS transporter
MLFAMTILAFGQGIGVPALLALVSKSTSAQRQGAVMGIAQSASSLARIVGPIFAVTVWMLERRAYGAEQVAPTWPFYFGGVVMLAAVAMAVLTRNRLISSGLPLTNAAEQESRA